MVPPSHRRPAPHRPARSRRSVIVLASVVALASASLGCGGDESEDGAPQATFTVPIPDTVEEVCEDRPGDLSTLAEQRDADGNPVVGEGRGTEPAGVDLVRAEARLDDDQLVVRWTTVAEPVSAPTPWFTLIQGTPGTPTSWGLRVDQDDEGRWRTSLLTNREVDDPRGLITSQEVATGLAAVPEVGATGVEVAVPRDELPPPATVAWLFGATSGEGEDTVFDDCSTLFGDGTTGGAPGATTGDTTDPTDVPGD